MANSFWKILPGLFLIINFCFRLRVQQQSLRPTLNSSNASPAWSRKWPSTKKMLQRPSPRWNDFWRSWGRWKMKRMTRRKKSMNWRGERGGEDKYTLESSAMMEKFWISHRKDTKLTLYKSFKLLHVLLETYRDNLLYNAPPLAFLFSHPLLILLPFIFFYFYFNSCIINHLLLFSLDLIHMYFCTCDSALVWACLFVCTCATIIPQKSLCFSSVAFSAVAKTNPSAANGGAGVGLPGHVSGWWPCQSIWPMHDDTHFACQKTGYETTTIAITPMWKSLWSESLYHDFKREGLAVSR